MIRRLTKAELTKGPDVIWNSFVEIVFDDPSELTDEQIPAHLVFLYESEVQNGGHLQYFENHGSPSVDLTIKALQLMGGACQAKVLAEARARYESAERKHPETAHEYVSLALEEEFEDLDSQFGACEPSLEELLEKHLKENLGLYIEIV
jgi:hypothetical protein